MMGLADLLILGGIAVWLVFVLRSAAVRKKNGGCAGCGGCGAGCCGCRRNDTEKND